MKTCTKCGETKSLEAFGKQLRGRLGLRAQCKACCAAAHKIWLAANPNYMRQWWSEPGRCAAIKKAWREKNIERNKEIKNKWLQSNPEKQQEYSSRYYIKNRQASLKRKKEFVENNRDYVNECARKRRALKCEAYGTHTLEETQELWRAQGGVCANMYCSVEINARTRQLDHIMPLSRGGSDAIANLQWLCATCNQQKNAKTPDEWHAWLKRKYESVGTLA